MMDQFVVRYMPGGMGLNHSSWWVVEQRIVSGMWVEIPIKFLKQADYR